MLYFLQIVNDGPIKMGYTRNIAKRVSAVATSVPYDLVMLGSADGTRGAESALLRAAGRDRIRGEWFAPTQMVKDVIRSYIGELAAIPIRVTKRGAYIVREEVIPREVRQERRIEMVEAVIAGELPYDVAEKFSVTPMTVINACKDMGVMYRKDRPGMSKRNSDVVNAVVSGEPIESIVKRLDVHPSKVRRLCQRAGVDMPPTYIR